MSEKRWAAEKRIALRTNSIEVLIQEARWQLDEHGSLDYGLAHELIIRASNQQQHIRELKADNECLWLQACKAELKLKITVSIAVGLASAFFVWLLL